MERRAMWAGKGPLHTPCRACWTWVWLEEAERVEMVDARAFYRCPNCGAAFLIRWEDALALGVVRPRNHVDEGDA